MPETDPRPPTGDAVPARGLGLAVGAVVVAAGLLRLVGLFGDLWLDEIWSIRMVETLGGPLDVFTVMRHDNNHPLNSLWLHAVGSGAPAWWMRAPAWVAGIGAVAAAAAVGRTQFRRLHPGDEAGAGRAALAAALALAIPYPFVHYASEARGYSAAVFFALLALWAVLRLTDRETAARGTAWRWAALYAGAAVAAFLAHPTAAVVLVGGVVIQVDAVKRLGEAPLGPVALAHGVPALALAAFVWGFVRTMVVGGGPINAVTDVLAELSAYTLGTAPSMGLLPALPLLLALFGGSLVVLARSSPGLAAAYLGMIVVAPAVGLATGPSAGPYPRYFLVPAAFAVVVISYGAARAWTAGPRARAAVSVGALAVTVGSALHAAALFRHGRGEYREALRHIAASSPFPEITLTSDFDFRNGTVVAWHADAAGSDRTVIYLPASDLPPRGAQWYLVHRLAGETPPAPEVTDPQGHRYLLDATYLHAGLSGWSWAVYRNAELPVTAPAP